jgi:MFS family permease
MLRCFEFDHQTKWESLVDPARRTLLSASFGTLIAMVAFCAPLSTVNPTVAGLHTGDAGRTWILSSMSIGLGAFLLTAGRFADYFGRRRTFVAGAVLLAVGAVVAALASDVVVFVLARIGQGIGTAALIASSLGMLAATFPDPRARARATGIWGASLGAGIAIGPLLSSGLALWHSWRDVYAVVVAAGVGLAVTARGCEESRGSRGARLDLPGVTLLALGMSSLLAGLTEGREGWARRLVVGLLAAGLLLLVAFLAVEIRSGHPMLDLGLFRRPAFAAVTLAAVANGAGAISLLSFLSGFVGVAFGWSAWSAAWLMLVWSVPSVATALVARRLPEHWTGRGRMAGALVLMGAGLLLTAGLSSDSGAVRFMPGLFVAGVGSGFLNAALGRESVSSVPVGQGGLGSGANNTARYLGSALGVTVVSVVAAPSGVTGTGSLVAGWNHAAVVTAAVSLVGALGVLLIGERGPAVVALPEIESPGEADAA